jgi:hypothetical protein
MSYTPNTIATSMVTTRDGIWETTSANHGIGARIQASAATFTPATVDASWIGQQVTIMRLNRSILGNVDVDLYEVRVVRIDPNGDVVVLPKGQRSKGYRFPAKTILAMASGWGAKATAALATEWETALRQIPVVSRELVLEDLAPLPVDPANDDASSEPVGLAVIGSHPAISGLIPGAVWLITAYDPETDIADGYLLLPSNEDGFVSEYGSCYGRDILNRWGVIDNLRDAIPFAEAMALGNVDYLRALDLITQTIPAPQAA